MQIDADTGTCCVSGVRVRVRKMYVKSIELKRKRGNYNEKIIIFEHELLHFTVPMRNVTNAANPKKSAYKKY